MNDELAAQNDLKQHLLRPLLRDAVSNNFTLADNLHALPHLNLTLQDISQKTFNFSSDQYIQSLEVYCLSGVVVGLLLFITFGFIQCCIGCRRCGRYNTSYRMKQYNPFLTSFLFICTIIIMLLCSVCLYFGVGRVQTNVNEMSNYIQDISRTIDEYDSLVNDIEHNIISLENQTKSLSGHSTIAVQLEKIRADIEREKIPDFKDDISRLIQYNRARELITAALILTEIFSCATLLIGICYGRVFVLHCSLIMLTLCMFLSCTSAGVYLSGAVASGDICVLHGDSLEYVREIVGVTEDVLQMFLKCKASTDSADDFNTVRLMDKALVLIHSMIGPADKVLPEITSTLEQLSDDQRKFQELFACQQIIKILKSFIQDYNKIIANLCEPFLYNMCVYCLLTSITVFLTWLVINQLKPYADRVEEWLRVERILDKNITMTPDADETEHLMNDTYPPPYARDYGSSMGYFPEENLNHLLSTEHSLYQSLLSTPYPQYPPASRHTS